ncbi:protein kinase [Luteolibacter arcticus]|uniref:Protein kinase n=1 Tax=Luteolibacter arcticus TaxID=1581411 RepID=A0ABT3GJ79_9BACT|nr:serine/threonine-protein kinase [Luteolibacter arcticus]MCW1923577.1 protein kinase [Luteolibacter arcticus]
MEERYEIRGKLGQGGLGAVYRAWDHALKREVAVKRIVSGDDAEHRDEATKQMEKETGALAALQHPNIVTIYDVGSDEDGPFVVMELLTGQTLDEIVEKAPLTWPDFRELVLQIQEALVAAQHLGLVHRDLKPSNIMVNWLPSGRFQTKIVDFGLAKFSPKTSIDTIEQGDIFGSIFYMAPEQFERGPIDSRLDMYSIGCVYYFTLTGQNPFQGESAHQVMTSHLEHRVIPLNEVRPDIPKWAADWVMWHINRYPAERPENGRESMKSFIQLDQPMSQAIAQPTPSPQPPAGLRPRMASGAPQRPAPVPTAMTATHVVKTHTAPQPLAPPDGAPPSVHTTAVQIPDLEPDTGPPPPDLPPPPATMTAPVPTVRRAPGAVVGGPTIYLSTAKKKKGMSEGQRNLLAVVGGLLLLVIIYFLVTQFSK